MSWMPLANEAKYRLPFAATEICQCRSWLLTASLSGCGSDQPSPFLSANQMFSFSLDWEGRAPLERKNSFWPSKEMHGSRKSANFADRQISRGALQTLFSIFIMEMVFLPSLFQ